MIYHRDTLSNVICNIRIPNGTEVKTGTAIFIAKDNEPYLLTAAHVVNNLNKDAYVTLSDLNGTPKSINLIELLGGASFNNHKTADLAKVKININESNKDYFEGRCFPYDQIDLSFNQISKDTELTTIGFPLGLGSTGDKFSPLSYRSFVASPAITLPNFQNNNFSNFIILELPSIGGYSGGPVFDLGYMITGSMTQKKEKTILHGIVYGTLTDNTGGKLAAVTPCSYLNDWF